MTKTLVVALIMALGTGAACSASDATSQPAPTAQVDETTPVDATSPGEPSSDAADADAFCAEYAALNVEQPESYVGSPEHLADIEDLLALASRQVADDLAVFRDFVASGAIDADDPGSNETANWPDEVQSAIERVQVFGSENC